MFLLVLYYAIWMCSLPEGVQCHLWGQAASSFSGLDLDLTFCGPSPHLPFAGLEPSKFFHQAHRVFSTEMAAVSPATKKVSEEASPGVSAPLRKGCSAEAITVVQLQPILFSLN